MGSSPSCPQQKPTIQQKPLNHSKFTNAKLFKYKQQTNFTTQVIKNIDQYEQWRSKYQDLGKKKFKIKSSKLLIPLESRILSQKCFCMNPVLIEIQFQNYSQILSNIISEKAKQQQRFNQQYLWNLLFNLLQAKIQANKNNFNLGDVQTNNIFVNQKGQIKVLNMLSFPGQLTPYQKIQQRDVVLLAPEQFQKIKKKSLKTDNYDWQIFSIGMTILKTGTLNNNLSLFDYQLNKFDYAQYNRNIQEWVLQTGYSQNLKITVLKMVSLIPTKRITCQDLYKQMERSKKSIQNNIVYGVNVPNDFKDYAMLRQGGRIHLNRYLDQMRQSFQAQYVNGSNDKNKTNSNKQLTVNQLKNQPKILQCQTPKNLNLQEKTFSQTPNYSKRP